MIGEVPEADKAALYRAAAVFVFPSRYEGFGLDPVEAMACGVPVVASDATSIPEVVGDAAVFAGPDDSDGWTAAVADVLSDPNRAASLRDAGIARARGFTWERAGRGDDGGLRQGGGMKVLMASKALVVGAYHAKLEALGAQPEVELLALAPESWIESGPAATRRAGDARAIRPALPAAPAERALSPALVARARGRGRGVPARHRAHRRRALQRGNRACLPRRSQPRRAGGLLRLAEHSSPISSAVRVVRALRLRARRGHRRDGDGGRGAAGQGFEGRLAVIPQFGVDPELFAPGDREPGATFRIGYAGRLIEAKGIELLLEAVRRIDGDVELLVAGTGPLEEAIRGQAAGDSRVRLLGALPSAVMPEFYQGLDVLVLPTLGRRGWTEQFGRAAIEAMACGAPVIVSDAGELPAVVGEAGRMVPAGDVEALRRALDDLREHADERGRLAEAGRTRVLAAFTHERIAEATAAFYQAVMDGPNR